MLITRGAVATTDSESPELAAAAADGLLRSAASEHPGRFGYLDIDDTDTSATALRAALGLGEEPRLAIREGIVLAPRLSRAPAQPAPETAVFDPDKTVLITEAPGCSAWRWPATSPPNMAANIVVGLPPRRRRRGHR